MKEKEEIEELVKACDTSLFNGTEDNFRSYDEGVRDALNWVLNFAAGTDSRVTGNIHDKKNLKNL